MLEGSRCTSGLLETHFPNSRGVTSGDSIAWELAFLDSHAGSAASELCGLGGAYHPWEASVACCKVDAREHQGLFWSSG